VPIGFVALDVDYYSSAKRALDILKGRPESYLPVVPVYLDDIGVDGSNPWTGELLAVDEFNQENALRKIAPFTLLRSRRIFKNTQWIDRMFTAHIHDHALRSPAHRREAQNILPNEYINWRGAQMMGGRSKTANPEPDVPLPNSSGGQTSEAFPDR